jgi:hypothetical protein
MSPAPPIPRLLAASVTFETPHSDALPQEYEILGELAHHLVVLIGRDEVTEPTDVISVAETLIAEGDRAVMNLVALGLLEDLQNITSHPDAAATTDMVARLLPQRCAAVWRNIDDLWSAVAEEVRVTGSERTMDASRYRRISSPVLRRFMQGTYRTMTDGTMIGVADVLRYEARHGDGPRGARF